MHHAFSRRRWLGTAALVAGAAAAGCAPATGAMLTPRSSRGPFYPRELPLDSDNDLTRVAGRSGVAGGDITDLYGRVLDAGGQPLADARVEIWQCDARGVYHHPGDRRGPRDENFQGYGQFVTGADGGYRFRTIRPVAYPGRTPHIHFAVKAPGVSQLVTQMYVAGEPGNARDGLYRSLGSASERVTVAFTPAGDAAARFEARFDLTLASA